MSPVLRHTRHSVGPKLEFRLDLILLRFHISSPSGCLPAVRGGSYEARLVFGEYHVEESWPGKTDDGIARLILGRVVLVNKLDRMKVVEYIHRHPEPYAV